MSSNFDPLQQFVGRVGKDPVVQDTRKGPLTKFSIAVSDGYGQDANTSWYNVAVGNGRPPGTDGDDDPGEGLQAAVFQAQIAKGSVVAIEGTVKQNGDYNPDVWALRVGLITWLDRSKNASPQQQQRQAPAAAPTSDDF